MAFVGSNPGDTLSINGDRRLPMQSVFKFHLALAVLHHIDSGQASLSDTLNITKDDLSTGLWSVIRNKYPDGARLTLAEVLRYTVANSDNVGCDILFRLLGGVQKVEAYLHSVGIRDIAITYDEAEMQASWERQYENWTTAKAANLAMKTFYENKGRQLSLESHVFLWQTMKKSWNDRISMKSLLPEGTVIAHKTGHSGKDQWGVTRAQNDIGIIFLPDGGHFFLSVLISDSSESSETNKQLIAEITKRCWGYLMP